MTVEEWAKDFKAFVNELQMPRDDYKGIIAYIEDGTKLLKAQETTVPIEPLCRYLEVYARTPIYNMRHTAEWWKEELNRQKWGKWMEEQHE